MFVSQTARAPKLIKIQTVLLSGIFYRLDISKSVEILHKKKIRIRLQ